MRIQNQIGNYTGADIPERELSALLLRQVEGEQLDSDNTNKDSEHLYSPPGEGYSDDSSANCSPTHSGSNAGLGEHAKQG